MKIRFIMLLFILTVSMFAFASSAYAEKPLKFTAANTYMRLRKKAMANIGTVIVNITLTFMVPIIQGMITVYNVPMQTRNMSAAERPAS